LAGRRGAWVSFDHRVGADKDTWRQIDAEAAGGSKIDDEFELGWPLDSMDVGEAGGVQVSRFA
jgi:hypothetical protein